MADTFPLPAWNLPQPDWGFNTDASANVTTSKLGDGYEFREPNGLNYRSESFQPVWSNLSPAVAMLAYNFLFERLSLKAFMWKHPVTNKVYQVLASGLSIEYDVFDNAILKVSFTQDFNPIA